MARPTKQGLEYFSFDTDFFFRCKDTENIEGLWSGFDFYTNLPAV